MLLSARNKHSLIGIRRNNYSPISISIVNANTSTRETTESVSK